VRRLSGRTPRLGRVPREFLGFFFDMLAARQASKILSLRGVSALPIEKSLEEPRDVLDDLPGVFLAQRTTGAVSPESNGVFE
jgi:hypothetical protein